MFSFIFKIIFISQTYLITNGEMIFVYPKPEPYRKHLFRIFEKYLDPGKVNFCIECDELIHLIPRTVALVTINRKDKIINWPSYNKVDTYIIDLTIETMEKLEFIKKTPGWNPRAKFFILYEKKNKRHLLQALLPKYIVNVVIFSSSDNRTLTITTYDPFKNGELRPKIIRATTIATITETNWETDIELDLFPNKYPKRWNDITIKVLPVDLPPYITTLFDLGLVGFDHYYLNSVGRKIGIKFDYSLNMLNDWGEKNEDGKYSLAFGALQTQEFGVSVGGFPASYPECVDFDMAYPVMEDYLVMVVPTSPVKERWKCILDIFEKPVWTSFYISVCLMTVVFYIISINKIKYDPSTSFLICLGCFLKVCLSKIPKSKSQRFLLMFWIVFCFLIDVYFESHLQGAFNNVQREKQIDSFEDIKEMGMKVAINKKYLQLFTNEEIEIDRYIIRNNYKTEYPLKAVNDSLIYKNSVVVTLEKTMKHSIGLFYVDPEDGSSTVHIISEKIMFIPLTMYFTKGFPPFDEIQRQLLNFKSIGFVERMYRFIDHVNQLRYHKDFSEWCVDPIRLDELYYIFKMLQVGLIISCFILLFEILWHKYTSYRNRKK